MRASAILLAAALAAGCARPGLTGTGSSDMLAPCRSVEPCGGAGGGGDLTMTMSIVLGTAVVGALAIAMHRYVVGS